MSAPENPLVSIVIPAYNAESFIQEAVDSALAQTYQNIEIIVVDDGSSDSTFKVLEQYQTYSRVKILTHPNHQNLGVSKTRQLGVQEAKGSYIAFLDADDTFLPEKIEIQINALNQFPNVAVCHTAITIKSELDSYPPLEKNFSISSTPYSYYLYDQAYFLKSNRICNSTTLIRGELLKELPFSSSQLFQYEDWLLWIMLSTKGEFLFLPQQLVQYRYHATSATNAIVVQPLKALYSKLELCLSAVTKLDDAEIQKAVVTEIQNTLTELALVYFKTSEHKDQYQSAYELISKVFDNDQADTSCSSSSTMRVIKKAQNEINRLELQIQTMQQSRFWRLRNKLLSLRKSIKQKISYP